ncbi:MAG: TIGR00282 family metallophosphoesterase [Alphaproteobacteria bacterium]
MKILAIGDIVGRTGREALAKHLPDLKRKLEPDFIIVNGENAASGFGLTSKLAIEMFELGVDVVTLGNHAWDQREMLGYIKEEQRIIRAINYPRDTPGRGAAVYQTKTGKKVMVAQVMGRLFMDPLNDPFYALDALLEQVSLSKPGPSKVDALVVDVHGEATSEKMALGHYLDGKASFVFGTHTHIPTADHQVLPSGTAYQSDLGMTGDYDSVIGMIKTTSIHRFTKKTPTERMRPASSDATVCGALVETDDATGLSKGIWPVRIGGRLSQILPELT